MASKAEHIAGKENPRFVVTSLTSAQWPAQALYEELYCARGDKENRIKEQFSLFAYRVSAETMRVNQLRLYLSTMAYILVSGLRRLGLKATVQAEAQVSTIRTKLLKIGAQIRVTVLPKTLVWGKDNGLDPTDLKWAATAIVVGGTALTLTEIIGMLGSVVIFWAVT